MIECLVHFILYLRRGSSITQIMATQFEQWHALELMCVINTIGVLLNGSAQGFLNLCFLMYVYDC